MHTGQLRQLPLHRGRAEIDDVRHSQCVLDVIPCSLQARECVLEEPTPHRRYKQRAAQVE